MQRQLADLLTAVQGVGPGMGLAANLQQAESDLANADAAAACSALDAFVHEVEAQAGKSIPASLADQLIADAQRIRTVRPC